jgi:hypothetical protein
MKPAITVPMQLAIPNRSKNVDKKFVCKARLCSKNVLKYVKNI